MTYEGLPSRLAGVREEIARRQAIGGWGHGVTIVAVTKGHGPEAVRAASAAGLLDVGENRVQEALPKQEAIGPAGLRWHLIGSLQRNKVRQVVGRFELIHSVDRPDLVAELTKRVGATRQAVLVEVNCSDEPQKGGVGVDQARALVDLIRASSNLEFRGLMTMAELSSDEGIQRRAFGRLRELRDRLERDGPTGLELSMGMSGDYPVAVEEGATMVRLGTILFGERQP
jgi:pyridoxal phosphate enzyme (YggS family)